MSPTRRDLFKFAGVAGLAAAARVGPAANEVTSRVEDGFVPALSSLRWVAASVVVAAELRDQDAYEHWAVMEQLAGGPAALGCEQERERCRRVLTTMLDRLGDAR